MSPAQQSEILGIEIELVRRYLMFIAEQILDQDLRAKAGPSDLVHEALLSAHLARDEFRGETAAEYLGWVRAILVNLIRNLRRRYRDTLAYQIGREVAVPEHRFHPADVETPSWAVAMDEEQARLADAVAALPEEDRHIIALSFDEGLSFTEIGARIGKSADASRMQLNRALNGLRHALGELSR